MAIRAFALAVLLAGCAPAPPLPQDLAAELRAAVEAARRTRTEGPGEVRLAERMTLNLQAGVAFVPAAEGARLLRALGRPAREGLLGVVITQVAGGTEATALYARSERLPGIPELDIAGWEPAPGLAPLAPR